MRLRFLLTILLLNFSPDLTLERCSSAESWNFVSIPDFLNADVNYPEPGWEDALDFSLNAIRAENPDFVLVAGDMVNGRWWRSPEQINYMADRCYSAWKNRMTDHGLDKWFVAVGDHEVGDNPWLPEGGPAEQRSPWHGTWDSAPLEYFPHYKEAFVRNFDMPRNGPEEELGTAYYVEHENVLLVTLDLFGKEAMSAKYKNEQIDLTQSQLDWLDKLLTEKSSTPFKIVQAHTPIVGPVRVNHSSGMLLKGRAQSPLWKLLVKHKVDLYLCGEVHAVTCIEQDGVLQISHGAIFGGVKYANYLVGRVEPDAIHLAIKNIDVELGGTFLPQSAGAEPRELVRITDANKEEGFKTIGTATIQQGSSGNRVVDKTGCFAEINRSN